jgi:hypothetical protein
MSDRSQGRTPYGGEESVMVRAGEPVRDSDAPSGSPGRRSARTSMSASAGFAGFRPRGQSREARGPKRLNRRRTAGVQRRPGNLQISPSHARRHPVNPAPRFSTLIW